MVKTFSWDLENVGLNSFLTIKEISLGLSLPARVFKPPYYHIESEDLYYII